MKFSFSEKATRNWRNHSQGLDITLWPSQNIWTLKRTPAVISKYTFMAKPIQDYRIAKIWINKPCVSFFLTTNGNTNHDFKNWQKVRVVPFIPILDVAGDIYCRVYLVTIWMFLGWLKSWPENFLWASNNASVSKEQFSCLTVPYPVLKMFFSIVSSFLPSVTQWCQTFSFTEKTTFLPEMKLCIGKIWKWTITWTDFRKYFASLTHHVSNVLR